MCGIFGYWDRQRRALPVEALPAMARKLEHRGPDDEGIWNQPQRGVAIGNRRLSIIDIGGGHQPFVSDDGQVAVVQNGEIFNYVELADELRAAGRHAAHALRHRSHPAPLRARRHLVPQQAQRHVRHRDRRCAPGCDVPRARPHRRQAAVFRRRRHAGGIRLRDQGDAALVRHGHRLRRHRPRGGPSLPDLQLHPRAVDDLARHPPRDARNLDEVHARRGGDPALVEPRRAARAGLRVRRLVARVHGHPGRCHPHPPARRCAVGRLSVGRRGFEHHRRADGAARGPAGQDLLHRVRRPAFRRVALRRGGRAPVRLRAHQRDRRAEHAGPLAACALPPGPAARRRFVHADAARERTGGQAREGRADRRRRRRAVRRLREVRGFLRAGGRANHGQRRRSSAAISTRFRCSRHKPRTRSTSRMSRRGCRASTASTPRRNPGSTRPRTSTA